MYLNGYGNSFNFIDHTVFLTYYYDSYNYDWRTIDRTAVIKCNFRAYVLSEFAKFKNENYVKMFI